MRPNVEHQRTYATRFIVAFVMTLFAFSSANAAMAQAISWATPERDTTTEIGGETAAVGVGAANWNNALWVAYQGDSPLTRTGMPTYISLQTRTEE